MLLMPYWRPVETKDVVRPSKTASESRDQYVELDALRGIAILGVVLVHVASSWLEFVRVPLVVPLLRVDATELLFFGSYGVTLFFLLSGYLLTWTEEKRVRFGTYSVRSYFLRRALRLVPAYYAAILVAVFCGLTIATQKPCCCTCLSCTPSTPFT